MAREQERPEVARRIGGRIALTSLWANLDGALFVFLFLEFLAPTEHSTSHASVRIDVIAFVAFMVVAAIVGTWRGDRFVRCRFAWMIEDREPTEDERRRTLSLPFAAAVQPLVVWAVAAVFFSALSMAYGHSASWAVEMSGTILLGGVVSAAVAFLLLERVCRPVFALALVGTTPDRANTMGVRPRLILTWALGSAVPLLGLAFLPWDAAHADEHTNIAGAVVVLSVTGLVLGFVTTVIAATSVADPLAEVRSALGRVQEGDLAVEVAVDDGGEVGQLQAGVNQMVTGLRERQRLADLFGRHVGTEVAQRALEQGTGISSEHREASALFVDLVGSTAMAEVLAPEDVVRTLNAFFDAVVRVVSVEGGWVNKFQGDGALCVFGTPALQPDHAARALRAARALHADLRELAAAYPGIDAAIGVSSGLVVAGNVGTESRYEYTVIGRPVNEAARLTDVAKGSPGRVLASIGALERAGDEAARWSSLGTVALRGQSAPTEMFEPVVVRAPV